MVKSISGLLRLTSGDVVFNGEWIGRLAPAERLRRGIAHIPEGRQIFAGMTVAENLDLGAYAASRSVRDDDRYSEVWSLFPILRERMNELAGNFSGGQQQIWQSRGVDVEAKNSSSR